MIAESKRLMPTKRLLVPLKRLKNAPHNPPNRILPKNLRKLVDSMDLIGLLQPVVIAEDFTIIEGHRRVAAAKVLEWDDIECVVIKEDPATVYASVNASLRKMSGNDSLSIWLKNPHAVPQQLHSKFGEMMNLLGKELVRRLVDGGHSYRVFSTACRIQRYCGFDSEQLKAITRWLIETATIGQVMKALEAGESAAAIAKAIKNNKAISFKMTVE